MYIPVGNNQKQNTMFDKIYCISGKGTAWENAEVLSRNGIDEILCRQIYPGVFYCSDLHVLFYRKGSDDDVHYNWDRCAMDSYDERWEEIKQIPFWRTHICRIDLPKQEFTEEEVLAAL